MIPPAGALCPLWPDSGRVSDISALPRGSGIICAGKIDSVNLTAVKRGCVSEVTNGIGSGRGPNGAGGSQVRGREERLDRLDRGGGRWGPPLGISAADRCCTVDCADRLRESTHRG